MGSEYYETPHIDALADAGMTFTDAYSCGPNCAPSRASLMTGLYTPRHGIYTVGKSTRGKAPAAQARPDDQRDGSRRPLRHDRRDAQGARLRDGDHGQVAPRRRSHDAGIRRQRRWQPERRATRRLLQPLQEPSTAQRPPGRAPDRSPDRRSRGVHREAQGEAVSSSTSPTTRSTHRSKRCRN